jgi:hypothetical protein
MARHRPVEPGPPYPAWPAIRAYGWRRWAAVLGVGLLCAGLVIGAAIDALHWHDRIREHDTVLRQHDGEKY